MYLALRISKEGIDGGSLEIATICMRISKSNACHRLQRCDFIPSSPPRAHMPIDCPSKTTGYCVYYGGDTASQKAGFNQTSGLIRNRDAAFCTVRCNLLHGSNPERKQQRAVGRSGQELEQARQQSLGFWQHLVSAEENPWNLGDA